MVAVGFYIDAYLLFVAAGLKYQVGIDIKIQFCISALQVQPTTSHSPNGAFFGLHPFLPSPIHITFAQVCTLGASPSRFSFLY